jgi:hypothetical protein
VVTSESAWRSPRRHARRLNEPDDDLLHARLVNWARAYRDRRSNGRAAGLSPDELDAEVVEVAMLRLQEYRPSLYAVLWQVYMAQRDDVTGSEQCRCSVATYKQRLRQGYAYLHGWFDNRYL